MTSPRTVGTRKDGPRVVSVVSSDVAPGPGGQASLPRASVLPEDLDRVTSDRSGHRPLGRPLAVVRAQEIADVVATLRWASARGVAVVPRGAGTGLAGGASAGEGSVVLDLSAMDHILEVSPEDGIAVVEPGVVTADLDRAARAHGLRYAPDPASVEISTVGGNIATNAGGLRCVKYGVTRDAVLALDVVLADGTLVRTGRRTAKGVAGYDLTSLLVGSEGTLGVVVGATVRLLPRPTATATAAAWFPSVEAAADAAADVVAAGLRPSLLELLDRATLTAIDTAQGTGLRARGEAFVLAQTDGFAAGQEIEAVAAVLRAGAGDVEVTDDPQAAERLLATRRAALPAIERLGTVHIEDIAVPRSQLAAAVRGVAEIAARTGVRIFTFAHAGDGNLHPILLAEDGPTDHVRTAVDQVFRLALDLGGTVTGEHGVGALKRAWLAHELDDATRALQERVKAAFDPQGVLNPGKAI